MMLSECKGFLWICAAITGCSALLSIALSLWIVFGYPVSPHLVLTTMSLFFLAFPSWLLVMLLLSEFTRATRGQPSFSSDPELGGSELASLTSHCPGGIWGITIVGIVFAVVQWWKVGDVDVALGGDISPNQLRGLLAGATVFLSLALPVLTSAALMEGGYGDQAE
ncbi:MAG: hypothetical protein NTV11_16210 [Rhodocyclales bacterium]|nr:hypothetical protein [Rhodocyclales bacterium]